jgi:hypothetical protein
LHLNVDVVAQPGKTGWLYVFNRVTGDPIWPIEERPVPKSDVPGEQAWPTQPFPTNPPPFARQAFTEKDISPYIDDPAEKARFLEDIRSARNEGMFTPVGLQRYTMEMPGNNGGSNFGSAATDPAHATVFVVSKDWPALLKLSAPPNATPQPDGSIPYEPIRFHGHDSRDAGDRAALERRSRRSISTRARSSGGFQWVRFRSSPRRGSPTPAPSSRRLGLSSRRVG